MAYRLADEGRTVVGFDGCHELISHAQPGENPKFLVMSYEEFAAAPQKVGSNFDVAVCNFSLLDEKIEPLLNAIHRAVKPQGNLLIQTVHPVPVSAGLAYQNGWCEETFESLPGEWSPMPWYFRTIGSWIDVLRGCGWQIDECQEPLHPNTGNPASLLFKASAVNR